jgi:hypothetical protein
LDIDATAIRAKDLARPADDAVDDGVGFADVVGRIGEMGERRGIKMRRDRGVLRQGERPS